MVTGNFTDTFVLHTRFIHHQYNFCKLSWNNTFFELLKFFIISYSNHSSSFCYFSFRLDSCTISTSWFRFSIIPGTKIVKLVIKFFSKQYLIFTGKSLTTDPRFINYTDSPWRPASYHTTHTRLRDSNSLQILDNIITT